MADTRAIMVALEAAQALNDAMRALQEMQAGLDAIGSQDLSEDIREVERGVDDARDVVLGTRRLAQVRLGLIDRETGKPIPQLSVHHNASPDSGSPNTEHR